MTYAPSHRPELLLSRGNITGQQSILLHGYNDDADTAAPEHICPGGVLNFPTTASVVTFASASTDDDGNPNTNTGTQVTTLVGLDASFDEQLEVVLMDGTTNVTSVQTYMRLLTAYSSKVGTFHGFNAGLVTGTISGDEVLRILTGVGRTQLGFYTVPNGKKAYLEDVSVTADAACSVSLHSYTNVADVAAPFSSSSQTHAQWPIPAAGFYRKFANPIEFAGKTDIWFSVTVAADNTAVGVDALLTVVDD